MINNRQNGRNNRRGRGGQRPMGGGNPGQRPDAGNRIDSRQRGNASQLLEKYKNLARDAQMQGDRVTAEYYLQFADHYFRVLNEHRARQEEFRERQDGQRDRQRHYDQRFDDDGDDSRDEDATGPIEIAGLPPAIGAVPQDEDADGESTRQDVESGDEEEAPSRSRGRRRPARAQASEERDAVASTEPFGNENADDAPGEAAPRAPRGRPGRRAAEPVQLELAPSSEEEGEAKPRRRVRKPRQENGDRAEV